MRKSLTTIYTSMILLSFYLVVHALTPGKSEWLFTENLANQYLRGKTIESVLGSPTSGKLVIKTTDGHTFVFAPEVTVNTTVIPNGKVYKDDEELDISGRD